MRIGFARGFSMLRIVDMSTYGVLLGHTSYGIYGL
jgi:hypothetical protein